MLLEDARDRAAGNFIRGQRAIEFFFLDRAQQIDFSSSERDAGILVETSDPKNEHRGSFSPSRSVLNGKNFGGFRIGIDVPVAAETTRARIIWFAGHSPDKRTWR